MAINITQSFSSQVDSVNNIIPNMPNGSVTFSEVSGDERTDYQSTSFSDLANANYSVILEVSDPESMGDAVAYDKAVNGFKIRITGSGGGEVKWKVVYN